jgi:YVTN family beta-propeller protein
MLRLVLALVIACVSVVALAASGTERAGHERAVFTAFSVTPPPGDDWRMAGQVGGTGASAPKAAYGTGFGDHSTALALVYAFAMPAHVKDKQEALKQAVTSAQRSGPRTSVRSSTSDFITHEGASCIRAQAIADDTGVRGYEGQVHTLTKWNMFCLHPQYPSFLVDMDYSERVEPGAQSPITQATRDGFLTSLKFERLERRVETIEVGDKVLAMTYAGDALWATIGFEAGTLVKIDPRTNTVAARVAVGRRPVGVVSFAGAMWVANQNSDNVMRIDPATMKVTATVTVARTPNHMATGFGSVWVTSSAGAVSRIDPATMAVTMIEAVGQDPMGIVVTPGGVFVSDPDGHAVKRIDPATNTVVQTLATGIRASHLIADGTTLWATDLDTKSVVQISTGEDARIVRKIEKVFTLPGRLLRAGPDLWVTDSKRDELVLFDVSTGAAKARRIPTPGWPLAMVEGGGAVWAASFNDGVVLRLDPALP